MNAFLVTQQGPPQPGWALQYTPDLKPAAARTYEPNALATHTTATNLGLLLRFYRLTGDTKFLARIPEALDWLESADAAAGRRAGRGARIRRSSSSARTGRSTCTGGLERRQRPLLRRLRPAKDAGALQRVPARRRRRPAEAVRSSRGRRRRRGDRARRCVRRRGRCRCPASSRRQRHRGRASEVCRPQRGGLLAGAARLQQPSVPRHGSAEVAAGDFSQTHVGDETDTSPYPDDKTRRHLDGGLHPQHERADPRA